MLYTVEILFGWIMVMSSFDGNLLVHVLSALTILLGICIVILIKPEK